MSKTLSVYRRICEWFAERAEARRIRAAEMDKIRSHPVLGQRCTICGKPRFWPPADECHLTHDLNLFGEMDR